MAGLFNTIILQTNVEQVVDLYNSGKMVIPDFQRLFEYKDYNKMNIISAILSGVSIDNITCVQSGKIQKVCDGMHRIKTLVSFLNDEFPFIYSLSKSYAGQLEIDKNLDGKKFSEFPVNLQAKIKTASLFTVLATPKNTKDELIIINMLMALKNSSVERVPEKRILLNHSFIKDTDSVKPWSFFVKNIKTNLPEYIYAKALNSSEIVSTFSMLLKFLDGRTDKLNVIVQNVCALSFDNSKTKEGLVADVQGALFWSFMKECNNATVDWDTFHSIYRFVKPMRYGGGYDKEKKNENYSGDRGLSILQRFNIMMVLFSNYISKRINKTKPVTEILERLFFNPKIPDDCKDHISAYLQ